MVPPDNPLPVSTPVGIIVPVLSSIEPVSIAEIDGSIVPVVTDPESIDAMGVVIVAIVGSVGVLIPSGTMTLAYACDIGTKDEIRVEISMTLIVFL